VYAFGKDKDLITVEIENVSIEALEALENEGVKVYPQPRVLRIIRDKGLQKQFYTDQQIPTAPFALIENRSDLLSKASYPIVHKLRTGGYDGKGVNILKSEADARASFEAPSIIENKIPFQKELSVIVARNENGEMTTFPCVEQQADEIAKDIIQKLDMVGLLAVEFFLTNDGSLLVNEIAPRPHNSGHHTIEICHTSQFAQHLRAILNLPLGDTSLIQCGSMINLVGEKGFEGPAIYDGLKEILAIPGVYPHIYGKEITKSFRKMGHVTITGKDMDEVREKTKKVQESIRVIA
jgi:5-(carboxyamino)imidazole ribonucleotide synthase